ncbi:acyl-CoA synthetase [Ephemerocybe angulata]|uniref:Acyl-CoA synthetase n=1 Tax=Ephemerocybe angulata TaxID=980116 RepID=A0A8H6HHI6_9AGAR|nr:acyl-CoA synthetase [Tulosesus angulatus]
MLRSRRAARLEYTSLRQLKNGPIPIQSKRNLLTTSFTKGPLEPPLLPHTLPGFWKDEILEKYGSRPALIARSEEPRAHGGPVSKNLGVTRHLAWDYEEFNRHVDAVARGLLGMGVRKGDRVGVIMGNTSAYATLQWACASIGAILTTINPAYRLQELVNTLNLVQVKHLFVVPRIRSSEYVRMISQTMQPGELQLEDLPALRNFVVVDNAEEAKEDLAKLHIKSMVDWREVPIWREGTREAKMQKEIEEGLDPDEVINLQFTSGTTGLPKAVSVGNLAAWTHGSCIVYPSAIYNPSAIVDAVTQEKCTALHGVPTHFLGVMSEVEKRRKAGETLDFSNLRTGIAAGTSVPIDLMRTLVSDLNLKELTNAYGMISFQTTPADPLIKRVETVGKIHPHVTAKVVSDKGAIVPVNTPGELHVSGYLLQKGYWEDEEHTNAVMKKDETGTLWMHTGDEAIMDEEGYVRIVGRVKNLFPVQIENILTEHPAIREAAVIAVPDPKYGETVGAWIVREPGAPVLSRKEVRELVRKNMNPQNAPAWVWFINEEGTPAELPKTASGKVQKHILRMWSKVLWENSIGKVDI